MCYAISNKKLVNLSERHCCPKRYVLLLSVSSPLPDVLVQFTVLNKYAKDIK